MPHRPVMIEEVMHYLNIKKGHTVADCTVGEGGHAVRMLEAIDKEGMLIGLDKDGEILRQAKERLGNKANVRLIHGNFIRLSEVLSKLGRENADGVLFDLGVSSYHLDDPKRGFSFISEGPLDMRLDRSQEKNAEELVNELPEKELAGILYEYGEEPKSRRIAKSIVEARKNSRITTTGQLKDLVVRATGGRHGTAHTATRTFQALRIAVNDELSSLHAAMLALPDVLAAGGRAVVISFHSLEDRIVKRVFRDLAATGDAKILTKKPVLPSSAEVEENPRARSAKLRALEVKDR